ncbi:MAG: RluA family pseudouridine synthase [Gemmatimonadota bacterium]
MGEAGPGCRHLLAAEEDEGDRLDRWLAQQWPDLSRSRLQGLITAEAVRVNGQAVRSSYRLRTGDLVAARIPEPEPLDVAAEALPLAVVFEDDDLLVVDKAAGMAVHPAPGSWTGTLVNALLHHCPALSGINGVLRPGIVHRLDRDTTGLLVVARNDLAHRDLAAQLEARRIRRQYAAVVWGAADDAGTVDAPIGRNPRDRKKMAVRDGGRRAVTHYRAVERFAFLTRLEVQLETGRTHQIRVHCQHLGHPVFGDPAYGGRAHVRGIEGTHRAAAAALLARLDRQALHARHLGFRHPRTGVEMDFEAPLPADLAGLLEAARAGG